jgi:hypothetical protein
MWEIPARAQTAKSDLRALWPPLKLGNMMTGSPLSAGAIKRICEGKASTNEPLWLQITTIKLMDRTDNNPNGIRYKYHASCTYISV